MNLARGTGPPAMTIVFSCHECGSRYRISDDRAGRRVKCKGCDTILQVPPVDEPEVSDDGTAIYRHEARNRDFELATGNEENIEAISNHIERHVGEIEMVFHELVSDLVHVDIHWVAPTDERPIHTLITSGMSDRPMVVPDDCEDLRFAELMITLPPDWPISQEAFEDESNYWPIRLMKMLARLPHEYETWLGVGHTVPNGDPAEPYSPDTDFSCALILPPVTLEDEFHELEVDGEIINFYAIVPLYAEETDYKLKHGLDKLLDRFGEADVGEVIEIGRKNSCRKKRFGLF